MLRLGILGLGEGRSTISASLASKKFKLIQICDANKKLCEERALEFDFHNWTTNYEDMLTSDKIDMIAIYTPVLCAQNANDLVCKSRSYQSYRSLAYPRNW